MMNEDVTDIYNRYKKTLKSLFICSSFYESEKLCDLKVSQIFWKHYV